MRLGLPILGIGNARRAGGVAPIVGTQAFGLSAVAVAYAPIIGEQSFELEAVAEEDGGTPVTALDPLTILSASTFNYFYTAEAGVTIDTGVSDWQDQSSANNDAAQAALNQQPAFDASIAAFGGRAGLIFDGSNDILLSAWNPPAPGTTPVWMYGLAQLHTNVAGRFLWCGANTNELSCAQGGANDLRLRNTTAGPVNAGNALNAGAIEALYNNGTTDYIRCGPTRASTTSTGTNVGNTNAGSHYIGGRPATNTYSHFSLAFLLCLTARPADAVIDALDAWRLAFYGV